MAKAKMTMVSWTRSKNIVLMLVAFGFGMAATRFFSLPRSHALDPDGKVFAALAAQQANPQDNLMVSDAAHPMVMPAAAGGQPQAPSLDELLPGLEAKVAANPNDVGLHVLLAQTYDELGQPAKAVADLQRLHKKLPQNGEISLALAKILMKSSADVDLRAAAFLFDDSAQKQPATSDEARLYQGQTLVKLGDRKGAIKVWNDYIQKLPPDDARRALIETELRKISTKTLPR